MVYKSRRGFYLKTETFKFQTKDGIDICSFKWSPANKTDLKGIVQISHGMAEHAARYGDIAEVLVKAGYAVYANDHRGHGKTAGILEETGYFAPKSG